MRKAMSMLLVPLLLLTMALPVSGAGYYETALAYLMEKYDVPEKSIELHDGGIMELEFTELSFWAARYVIGVEGGSIPSNPGGSDSSEPGAKPEPAPMPMPIVAPDDSPTTPSGSGSSPVSSPMDMHYDNISYGAVYILLGTDKILDMYEMEEYYRAEQVLADKEWERLRNEAGKLDVSLYQKLKGLPATEEVKVLIIPTAVATDALKDQFQTLKDKYPLIAEQLDLADVLFNGYGYAHDLPADGETSSIAIDPAEREPMIYDDDYWQEYQAFWEAVDEIRVKAVSASLETITATLDSLGTVYSNLATIVEATLTGAQINQVLVSTSVATIAEQYAYGTMDSTMTLRGSASAELTSTMPPVSDEATEAGGSDPTVLIILAFTALGAGSFILYRRLA